MSSTPSPRVRYIHTHTYRATYYISIAFHPSLFTYLYLCISLYPIYPIYPIYLVLVGLYEEPERPPNAVDYIKRYMGAPTGVDVDALRFENEALKKDVARLEKEVKELAAAKVS